MDLVPDISLNVIVNVFLLSTMHQIVGPNKSVLKKKSFHFLKTLFTQCCLRPMIASKVIVQFGNRSSGWFSYPNIIYHFHMFGLYLEPTLLSMVMSERVGIP